MKYCVYYDKKFRILDYLPTSIEPELKGNIAEQWNQDLPRKILLALSEMGETTIPKLKKRIGHSMSTLHENMVKLEQAGLVKTKITYVGNKKKTIIPRVLFVTKNPRFRVAFKKFFQGLWIDSKKSQTITRFLQKHPATYYTAEELSRHLHLPVDEIEMLLSNWDNTTTRTLSNFMQEKPFEKKIMYRGRKTKK